MCALSWSRLASSEVYVGPRREGPRRLGPAPRCRGEACRRPPTWHRAQTELDFRQGFVARLHNAAQRSCRKVDAFNKISLPHDPGAALSRRARRRNARAVVSRVEAWIEPDRARRRVQIARVSVVEARAYGDDPVRASAKLKLLSRALFCPNAGCGFASNLCIRSRRGPM